MEACDETDAPQQEYAEHAASYDEQYYYQQGAPTEYASSYDEHYYYGVPLLNPWYEQQAYVAAGAWGMPNYHGDLSFESMQAVELWPVGTPVTSVAAASAGQSSSSECKQSGLHGATRLDNIQYPDAFFLNLGSSLWSNVELESFSASVITAVDCGRSPQWLEDGLKL